MLLVERGILQPDERVELIDGEILFMTPPSPRHSTAVRLVSKALAGTIDADRDLRIQQPLLAGERSQPEPDIAVVAGDTRLFRDEHPTAALLAVEVSVTSAVFDATIKANLYASIGIPEYWVLDIEKRRLQVYRDPREDSKEQFGSVYRTVTICNETDTISPLYAPGYSIDVAGLMP